jgi:sec-independent protein translocase protein TatA
MFGDIIQPTHLLFILAVALIVLGPRRLPEVGRSLGKGIRDFRSAMAGLEEQASGLLKDESESSSSFPVGPSQPVATFAPATTAQVAVVPEPESSEYAD